MAVGRTWSNDWLSENGQRRYPLVDSATLFDTSAQFELPTNFIVDLSMTVPASELATTPNPNLFFVSSVGSYASGYIVSFSYDTTVIGTIAVPRATHTWGKAYTLVGKDPMPAYIGSVCVGDLDTIDSQPAGLWTFASTATAILASRITFMPSSLSGIKVLSKGVLSKLMTGRVNITAGQNALATVTQDEGVEVYHVALGAVGNVDYTAANECVGTRPTGSCIRTINGIAPVNYNFSITPSSGGVSIVAAGNGIMLDDVASKPCCGADDLNVVLDALRSLNDQYRALTTTVNSVVSQSQKLSSSINETLARIPKSTS